MRTKNTNHATRVPKEAPVEQGCMPVMRQGAENNSRGDLLEEPVILRRVGAGFYRTTIGREVAPVQDPLPIWLAALIASGCQATGDGADHAVRWSCVAGRAVYTNISRHTETILPLDVLLRAGYTLEVYWLPGESAYNVQVYPQN